MFIFSKEISEIDDPLRMALEKWEILMGQGLVTTAYSPLSFSSSLCNPLFHLTEAGNAKTKLSAPALSRGMARLTAPTALPHTVPLSWGQGLFTDEECPWVVGRGSASHTALLSKAGNADMASAPAFSFFLFSFCWKELRQLLL